MILGLSVLFFSIPGGQQLMQFKNFKHLSKTLVALLIEAFKNIVSHRFCFAVFFCVEGRWTYPLILILRIDNHVGCALGAFCVCEHSEIYTVPAHSECGSSCYQCRCCYFLRRCSSKCSRGECFSLSFFPIINLLIGILYSKMLSPLWCSFCG